jgi:hypothetical protein
VNAIYLDEIYMLFKFLLAVNHVSENQLKFQLSYVYSKSNEIPSPAYNMDPHIPNSTTVCSQYANGHAYLCGHSLCTSNAK